MGEARGQLWRGVGKVTGAAAVLAVWRQDAEGSREGDGDYSAMPLTFETIFYFLKDRGLLVLRVSGRFES
jgi:hypothetical protein